LKIEIQKDSKIAGLLDTDELNATAAALVKHGGKLLVREKTFLMADQTGSW
jgi:hypothetical protein